MIRTLTAVGATLGVLLTAQLASAQAKGGFGEQGQLIFSADRLMPVLAYTNDKFTNDSVSPSRTTTTSGTSLSFLWGSNAIVNAGGGVGAGLPNFYTTPRVGFDYVLIPSLTVGGDLFAFFTLGGNTTRPLGNNMTVSTDNPSGNAFGIAPRVGYILDLTGGLLSLWLRGGVHFYTGSSSTKSDVCPTASDSNNVHVFGIDLDPQLVISPTNHFAFSVGPTFDWGFAGGASNTQWQSCGTSQNTSNGYSSLMFGATGGLLGWF
jgi:hypothetical protein